MPRKQGGRGRGTAANDAVSQPGPPPQQQQRPPGGQPPQQRPPGGQPPQQRPPSGQDQAGAPSYNGPPQRPASANQPPQGPATSNQPPPRPATASYPPQGPTGGGPGPGGRGAGPPGPGRGAPAEPGRGGGGPGRGGGGPGRGGRGDSGRSAASVDQLNVEMEAMMPPSGKRRVMCRPRKPDGTFKFGTFGRPIKVRMNFFEVKVPEKPCFKYDVQIIPEIASKEKRNKIMKQLLATNPDLFRGNSPAFDGNKNIFVSRQLPADQLPITLHCNWDKKDWEFQILKHTMDICLTNKGGDDDMFQCLQTVLNMPARQHFENPRSVFYAPMFDEQAAREPIPSYFPDCNDRALWFGYSATLRPGWKMHLNIDITAAPHLSRDIPLVEWFHSVCKAKERLPSHIKQKEIVNTLSGMIKAYKISYDVKDHRVKRTAGLVPETAQTKMIEDLKETVQQYFLREYKITLRYPDYPLVLLQPATKGNTVPMELCTIIAGQRIPNKDAKPEDIIRKLALSANVKEGKVMAVRDKTRLDGESILREFGLQVSREMATATGRVLPALFVQGQPGPRARPEAAVDAVWTRGSTARTVAEAGLKVNAWVFIVCNERTRIEAANQFCGDMLKEARNMGLQINNDPDSYEVKMLPQKDDGRALVDYITEQHQQFKVQLVFMVLPFFNSDPWYQKLKCLCDKRLRIASQAIQSKHLDRIQNQTIHNILLKVNTKLGGRSHDLFTGEGPRQMQLPQMFDTAVIVMGADVTHGSTDDRSKPSVAAVVGSVDRNAFKYCAEYRTQCRTKKGDEKKVQEIILELKDMAKDLLKAYHRAVKMKPTKILFYRDGVSDGQFAEVLSSELYQLQQACKELQEGYTPQITFITVKKRHHANMFPVNPQDCKGRGKNVPTGTVVDNADFLNPGIWYEEFAVYHDSIQGTARPIKVVTLHDDSNLHPDQLQLLTQMLCHMAPRCHRAVSLPIPIYHAHFAAKRALVHIQEGRGGTTAGEAGDKYLPMYWM